MNLISFSNLPWDTAFRAGVGPVLPGSDRTVVGTPDDIDAWLMPEHDGDIEYENAGGSPTNAALVFAGLGGTVTIAGPVGRDLHGLRVRTALARPRVTLREIVPAPDRQAHSLAFAAPAGERRFLATLPCLDDAVRFDGIDAAGPGWLLASAYELSDPAFARIVLETAAIAVAGGRSVVLDLADPNFVMRRREAVDALIHTGLEVLMTGPDALDAVLGDRGSGNAANIQRLARTVLITRGADGVEWITGGARHVAPAVAAPVRDTTGAGDAFLGAFLFGEHRGRDTASAVTLGTEAAALIVERTGARAPAGTWEQLRRTFEA